jgi:hypothetical protein
MKQRKAVYYGQVELIPGIICDGYVLNDGTAVMSERGTANLLGVDHMLLNRMETNGPPKTLKPFIDKGWSMETNLVKVVVKNDVLRENQKHIGKRCVILQSSLVRTALETAIKEACGLSPNIQQTAQQNYIDAVKLLQDFGFTCSAPNDIATKKDITRFLDIPESTLNSFLKNEIQPIQLDSATIRSFGGKASRMNGYKLDDVTKIALGMDSVIGIKLKKQVFGQIPRNTF